MKKKRRKTARDRPAREEARGSVARPIWTGVLLFGLAFALRLLFWQATPDAGWPYSAYYKGDAPIWLSYAQALIEERPFELGLPLRPPGAAYLAAALWDGQPSGVAGLRAWWCVFGALTVPLVFGAALRGFGFGPALLTGFLCAISPGLMMLSTSLDNETPYLLLVAAILYLGTFLSGSPRLLAASAWGALNGLACLVRVEHALFFGLVVLYLAMGWFRRLPELSRREINRAARPLALIVAVFLLVLMPWHLHAWQELSRFNTEERRENAATEAAMSRLEQALSSITWEPEASAARERLPAFIRRTSSSFVTATVALRGGRRVELDDLGILEEAFGYLPEPVGERPFVAMYGGLNFYLANNPYSQGGFDRSILEEAPPLAGGVHRYPAMLVTGLPPPDLAFAYPPHLEIVNHGYRLGWRYIRQNPGDWLALAGRKLAIFWDGAALGVLGYNLPLGLSGIRRSVDLVVPEGPVPALWRLAVLGLVGLGIFVGLRSAAWRGPLVPWLLFLASKVAVTVVFFGYARQGATAFPVVALLVSLAAVHLAPALRDLEPSSRTFRVAATVAIVLVAVEGVRFMTGPALTLDGRPVGVEDPWPAERHQDRRLEIG